jgi:hypothetical protein
MRKVRKIKLKTSINNRMMHDKTYITCYFSQKKQLSLNVFLNPRMNILIFFFFCFLLIQGIAMHYFLMY